MMSFTATSTVFIYTDPVNSAGVIRGVSIDEHFEVVEVVGHGGTNAVETWCKVEDGWIMSWNGFHYGHLREV